MEKWIQKAGGGRWKLFINALELFLRSPIWPEPEIIISVAWPSAQGWEATLALRGRLGRPLLSHRASPSIHLLSWTTMTITESSSEPRLRRVEQQQQSCPCINRCPGVSALPPIIVVVINRLVWGELTKRALVISLDLSRRVWMKIFGFHGAEAVVPFRTWNPMKVKGLLCREFVLFHGCDNPMAIC